jgi:hypothetical protein
MDGIDVGSDARSCDEFAQFGRKVAWFQKSVFTK